MVRLSHFQVEFSEGQVDVFNLPELIWQYPFVLTILMHTIGLLASGNVCKAGFKRPETRRGPK